MLAAVVILGMGGRMWRGRVTAVAPAPESVAQLDTQLARVDSASGKAKSGTARAGSRGASRARGQGKEGTRPLKAPAGREPALIGALPRVLRAESTPIGALDRETAARRFDENRVEVARNRADSKNEDARSPVVIVDLDRADARTIETLPRIGPALARRIVEDRSKNGAFGSLAQLQRVRGIGPALASQLEGRVTFGGTGRPSVAEFSAGNSARAIVRRSRQRDRPP